MGYYQDFPDSGYRDSKRASEIAGAWLVPSQTPEQVKALMKSFEAGMNSSQWSTDLVYGETRTLEIRDFSSY